MTQWTLGAAGKPEFDRTVSPAGIAGLFSNVAEWTFSPGRPYPAPGFPALENFPYAGDRIGRGGPSSVINFNPDAPPLEADWAPGPRMRMGLNPSATMDGLGLRGARSKRPRLTKKDFGGIVMK